MELTTNEKVWLSLKDIQEILSVSGNSTKYAGEPVRAEGVLASLGSSGSRDP